MLVHGLAIGLSLRAPPVPLPPPPVVLTQNVTLQKPPPPPAPPLEPPPPPHRAPAKPAAAAVAGKVVAVAPTPDRPLDMTGFDMVIGKGNVYAGGVTASTGTSLTAVANAQAPRGTGASQARVAAPARTDWACAWPEEEEKNTDLRSARVLIRVLVDRDGDPQTVDILGPASPSFEQAARRCALNETYLSARDESGHAISGSTPPFSVHFFR